MFSRSMTEKQDQNSDHHNKNIVTCEIFKLFCLKQNIRKQIFMNNKNNNYKNSTVTKFIKL